MAAQEEKLEALNGASPVGESKIMFCSLAILGIELD